jgi:hypothetical protein
MSDILEDLWQQLVWIERTKGLDHPDFGQMLEQFHSERRRRTFGRRFDSLGSASNGFEPQHPGREEFGVWDHDPDLDEI